MNHVDKLKIFIAVSAAKVGAAKVGAAKVVAAKVSAANVAAPNSQEKLTFSSLECAQ
jgi:hypothetical protein